MAKQYTYTWSDYGSVLDSPIFTLRGCTRALWQLQVDGDSVLCDVLQNDVALDDGSPNPDAWYYVIYQAACNGGGEASNFSPSPIDGTRFLKEHIVSNSNSGIRWTGTHQELETYPAR